uniref:CREB/ATF bZIP transcription factor n=1 Tax=Loxodonta africana TaxID=9785 RepID=G3TDL8_LOXAF
MRHSLTKLLAASGSDSSGQTGWAGFGAGASPAPQPRSSGPRVAALLPGLPDLTRSGGRRPAENAGGPEFPGRRPAGDESELEAGRGSRGGVVRAPSPEEMKEEAIASVPREESEDMDFLSGLELADLLDPRQPDWHLEPGLSSPGPLSSSGGGSENGGLWRGDDDDEAAAAEMQRFSDLLQRLITRLNRLKKKEYVMGLESRVRGLAAENQELRAENRELGKRVQALQEESRYLRAVLANETGLARLLSRLSGVGLRLTTSLFRDSPAGDHDYALPVGKQQQDLLEEDDSAGGVCLHVDKDKVSVEFCSACARKASSSLKM